MDKRTILFVLSLTFTLFFVNIYFERQNRDTLKEWQLRQEAKKDKKIKGLESEIASRTEKEQDLPLVKIYRDQAGRNTLTTGIHIDDAILTLSWRENLPKTIYAQQREYTLAFSPDQVGGPALYRRGPEKDLPIANLPHFGTYDLQLVTPQPLRITLGNFSDGHFSIPTQELSELKGEEAAAIGNAFVLMKTDRGYLPIAVYNHAANSLTYLEQIHGLRTFTEKPEVVKLDAVAKTAEKFYVLEDDYQQLVFSNYGGSLAEINLPFQTDENEKSVVREIEFDRDMVEQHPFNAHFPIHSYLTPDNIAHDQGKLGGYYPLIRRDLIQTKERKSVRVLPQYYALNIVSEYPEMAELVFEIKHFDKNTITFEAVQPNRRITKTYTIGDGPYILDLTIKIEGNSRGLWLTSGIPEVEWINNRPAPALKYRITRKQKSEVVSIDHPKESTTVSTIYPDWICNSNGFLGLIIDPLDEIDPGYRAQFVPVTVVPSRLIEIDREIERFKAKDLPGYMMMIPLNSKGGTMHFRIFAGPFADSILKTVDRMYSDPETGYNPDYIASQTFHGWFTFISAPFSKFLFILLNFFHFLTGSWAFSIILLTVALRVMLYPLNAWSTKSMVKMQLIAPEITAIQEKYKKDSKKAQLAIMNLYRDRGVNPVSGCFPMLIQMPFLIGMFDLLKTTFELRGASFIPGWIDNLASPDVLFSWTTPIFFIGNQFHLLPVLLGAVMFMQQKVMSTLPKDPSQLTDQQRQQKAMGTMMSLVFTFMFYNFPSGLNIYWLSSMLLGIAQQWWTQKRLKAKLIQLNDLGKH